MALALGKQPATYSVKDLRYTEYRNALTPTALSIPSVFGHSRAFTDWGMLGNDTARDCVWAGAAHETMLFNNLAGRPPVNFTDQTVLSDYSASTGYDPNNPQTDQGTNVRDALDYRRKTGIVDAQGKRHRLAGYVALEPGNIQHIIEALWIFEAVGIGVQFPTSAMDQFNNGQVWSVASGSPVEGGHYIPLASRPAPGNFACITWGKRQVLTDQFFSTYCDEAFAFITHEGLNARTQKNWGGFDWASLQRDLQILP